MLTRMAFCWLVMLAVACSARAQGYDPPWEADDTGVITEDTSAAQPSTQLSENFATLDPPWHFPVSYVPRDWGRSVMLIPQPASLQVLAGVGLATVGLLAIDGETHRVTREAISTSPPLHQASWTVVHFGDGRYHLALSGAMIAFGYALDDKRAIRTGGQIFESMLASGIVVQALKRMIGRESPAASSRPGGSVRPFPSWSAYNHHQTRYYSFPSGHITTTMSTVTVLAENYPEAGWIRPVGYAIVGLVGISLVNVGYHWYSDLPLGILLGYTFGMLAAHPAWTGEAPGELSHLRAGPGQVGPTTGVQIAWVF